MTTNPTELIAARRREIEAEIAQLTGCINDLKAELPDLAAAERVIQRLSGQGANQPGVADADAATSKPAGTPTIPVMIIDALKDARNRGLAGLKPKTMTAYIAKRWWPNVPSVAISPIAWRMAKRGDLIKRGSLYKLPPRNTEAADLLSEAPAASDHQPPAQGREAGPGGGT